MKNFPGRRDCWRYPQPLELHRDHFCYLHEYKRIEKVTTKICMISAFCYNKFSIRIRTFSAVFKAGNFIRWLSLHNWLICHWLRSIFNFYVATRILSFVTAVRRTQSITKGQTFLVNSCTIATIVTWLTTTNLSRRRQFPSCPRYRRALWGCSRSRSWAGRSPSWSGYSAGRAGTRWSAAGRTPSEPSSSGLAASSSCPATK